MMNLKALNYFENSCNSNRIPTELKEEINAMKAASAFTVEMPMPVSKVLYYALEAACNGDTSKYGQVLADTLLNFVYIPHMDMAHFQIDNDDLYADFIYPLAEKIVDNHPEMADWYLDYKGYNLEALIIEGSLDEMMPFIERHPAILEYLFQLLDEYAEEGKLNEMMPFIERYPVLQEYIDHLFEEAEASCPSF